jgi:hypothetical protein
VREQGGDGMGRQTLAPIDGRMSRAPWIFGGGPVTDSLMQA